MDKEKTLQPSCKNFTVTLRHKTKELWHTIIIHIAIAARMTMSTKVMVTAMSIIMNTNMAA